MPVYLDEAIRWYEDEKGEKRLQVFKNGEWIDVRTVKAIIKIPSPETKP